MSGFSPRNIKYMRKFAECWSDFEFVQQVVAQIPWRTNRMILDKLDSKRAVFGTHTKPLRMVGAVKF